MTLSILVATDLSPRGDRAVARTFRMAEALEARVQVLNVVDSALPDEMATRMEAESEALLNRFAENLPQASKVTHGVGTITGDPAAAIVAEAMSHDLLVLGTHRPRPFMDLFRETTMERIVRTLDRPVLLVRDPADHDYRRVLAALDFAPAASAALRLAATLAPEAELHALHAVHIPYRGFTAPPGAVGTATPFLKDAQEQLRRWRDIEKLPNRLGDVEIIEGPAHGLLLRRVETLDADLLAVGAHGRAGAAPALLGSLANDLIRTPPCDLLVAR